MNIHEYQAKGLLAKYGVAVPRGGVAYTAEEAEAVAKELGGSVWVVKAQIHAGGRGKGGGVKVVHSTQEVKDTAREIVGMTLVTPQTGPKGKTPCDGQVFVMKTLPSLSNTSASRIILQSGQIL